MSERIEIGQKSNPAGGQVFVRCHNPKCGYGYWITMWPKREPTERQCPYCGHVEPGS